MGENVWIVVCRDFHGAVGPIPTEAMARELAAGASEATGCTYQAVQLRIVGGRGDVGSSGPRDLRCAREQGVGASAWLFIVGRASASREGTRT